MKTSSKLAIAVLVTAGAVLVIRHGAMALHPAIPKDMPGNSYFVQSGYNLNRNEPTGQWIACREDSDEGADFCRVTDTNGTVIYQGDFLPVNGSKEVSADQLRVAAKEEQNLWVDGPAESSPVPAIPLANGEVLVPRDDTYALAYRWSINPDELHRVEGE